MIRAHDHIETARPIAEERLVQAMTNQELEERVENLEKWARRLAYRHIGILVILSLILAIIALDMYG